MRVTTHEQKEAIRRGIKLGKSYGDIALELRMTKRTVKKWGQKIKRGDPLNLRIGRPRSGTLGSFSPQVKELIDEYRPSKGGWGAITIKTELELDKRAKGEKKTIN